MTTIKEGIRGSAFGIQGQNQARCRFFPEC
jgi:hypothetical protein